MLTVLLDVNDWDRAEFYWTLRYIPQYNRRIEGTHGPGQDQHASIRIVRTQAVRAAAERERRSIVDKVEVLIRDHCCQAGVAISDAKIILQ